MRIASKPARLAAALVLACAAQLPRVPAVFAASSPSPGATGGSLTFPLVERNNSGVKGTVTLSPQGSNTMIDVTMFSRPSLASSLSLRSGADCADVPGSAAERVRLNPVSSGSASHTIVAIPLSAFTRSKFVVDVRDATAREQASEACALIGR